MKNPFNIFKIKSDEKYQAPVALLYVILWNVLVVYKYSDKFFALSDNYRQLFGKFFHISGFDPISYWVLSNWSASYNIYRHPLLAFFMWIPNQINQGLMLLTGSNFAVVVMALILVFCGFYSFILLKRTFTEVIGLKTIDAWLLSWLTFSFGYVMVIISVPDHFCLSMFMLILTLYVAGKKIKAKHPYTIWQTVLFFIVTAGISLNNGIKVFLANWFTNGRKFWRPKNLILAILLPSLVIWIGARLEWRYFERPDYLARVEKRAQVKAKQHDKIAKAFRDTTKLKDSAAISKGIAQAIAKKDSQRKARQMKRAVYRHTGKPINHTEFGQWTDITTPRWSSLVENIFGEPIQLHQDYLLKDVLVNRPVIVYYRYFFNYIVEGIIALLFLCGIFFGRHEKFLWLALSFFGFDMLIHFVLGFGLNEVYIMSPHWLFVLTIAIGYLVRCIQKKQAIIVLRSIIACLIVYLILWNGILYGSYLL